MLHYYDYSWSSLWQVLAMNALLATIWVKKDCSGLSLRSQVLYVLVITTRHPDMSLFFSWPEGVLKIAYFIGSYGTVLSMLLYFRKTYEKQYDIARIDIWIIACIVLGLFIVDDPLPFQGFPAFSVCLEVIAMIPQFQFTVKAGRTQRHVVLYAIAMAVYAIFNIERMRDGCDREITGGRPSCNFLIAAAYIQLLLYCDFFCKVCMLLISQDDDCQSDEKCNFLCFVRKLYFRLLRKTKDDVEANIENEELEKGQLAGNAAVTPSTLTEVAKDKELATAEDVNKT